MSKTEQKICLTTLAIGSKYRTHALQLAEDIKTFCPQTPFIILTDAPQIFSGKDFIIPVKHSIQSVGIYHDKLNCIEECFHQGFNCCIFLDADCRLLSNVADSRHWKVGVTAKSCNSLGKYITKSYNKGMKDGALLIQIAENYDIPIEQCKFVQEYLFIICRDETETKADKFLQIWKAIRDNCEVKRVYAGEGAAIGMAAQAAGWEVHHYDTGYLEEQEKHLIHDVYKDRIFTESSTPEYLKDTINKIDKNRRAIEEKQPYLFLLLAKIKNLLTRELRYISLLGRTFLS